MTGIVATSENSQSRSILGNSLFLIANTFSGSAFGFVAWLVAAHGFTASAIGTGAACLSALTFLATIAEMGLGTAIIRFAPRLGSSQPAFINSALVATAVSTAATASLFAWSSRFWSHDVGLIGRSALYFGIFVGSAVAFGLAQLVDRIFIAFETSSLLFARNLVASLLRVALIIGPARSLGASGLVLAIGAPAFLTSGLALWCLVPRAVPCYRFRPVFARSILLDKAQFTLGNHIAVLLWNAPQLIYPLLVVALLGPGAGAQFYFNWMLANMLFIVPASVSTSTFARAAHQPEGRERAFRQSLLGTAAILVPATGTLLLTANTILRGFGPAYADAGHGLLFPLALSVFPYTLNMFALAYLRIQEKTVHVLAFSGIGAVLCLALSLAGTSLYGLSGIGLGWLAGQVLAALVVLSTNLASMAIIGKRQASAGFEHRDRCSISHIRRG